MKKKQFRTMLGLLIDSFESINLQLQQIQHSLNERAEAVQDIRNALRSPDASFIEEVERQGLDESGLKGEPHATVAKTSGPHLRHLNDGGGDN